jgi:DNA-binding CsgD family transcriptional regulator
MLTKSQIENQNPSLPTTKVVALPNTRRTTTTATTSLASSPTVVTRPLTTTSTSTSISSSNLKRTPNPKDRLIEQYGLKPCELQILQIWATDPPSDVVLADMLGLTEGTTNNLTSSILKKLEVASRMQALVKALRLGIVELAPVEEMAS